MITPTYVFVHGSHSNSFSWAPLQRELALLGHRSLAVDLPGHGFAAGRDRAYQAPQDLAALATAPSALTGVTHADTVAHVVQVVRRVAEHGPVVLVGHSRGGFALTGVANAAPDLLDRLVYISAWCCVDAGVAEYARSPENAGSALDRTAGLLVGDPFALGAVRMNWRTADPDLLGALKEAVLADGTDAEFLAFLTTLEPDEGLDAGDDRADPATWGRVRHSYVRLTADRSIPVAAPGPVHPRGRRAGAGQPVRRALAGQQPRRLPGPPGAGRRAAVGPGRPLTGRCRRDDRPAPAARFPQRPRIPRRTGWCHSASAADRSSGTSRRPVFVNSTKWWRGRHPPLRAIRPARSPGAGSRPGYSPCSGASNTAGAPGVVAGQRGPNGCTGYRRIGHNAR